MEPSEDTPPAPLTDEDVVAGTTVEDITAIENSIEPPVVATTGDINSGAGSHPEQALHGACHGQGPGDGQEDRTPVSESEVKHSVVPAGERPNQTSSDIPAWSHSALLSI